MMNQVAITFTVMLSSISQTNNEHKDHKVEKVDLLITRVKLKKGIESTFEDILYQLTCHHQSSLKLIVREEPSKVLQTRDILFLFSRDMTIIGSGTWYYHHCQTSRHVIIFDRHIQ
jgi:hypothetical protein